MAHHQRIYLIHVLNMIPVALVLLTVSMPSVVGRLQEIPIPADIKDCFDRSLQKGNLSTQIGEKVAWRCVHGTLWGRNLNSSQANMPEVAIRWFTNLIHDTYREAHRSRRMRRQATRRQRVQRPPVQLRLRREYRLLSDGDRNRFHRAIVLLKMDRSIPPNRYDALGRLHEMMGERSHDGPNFLGWHRFFLIVVENALREKVPGVTIPYWDSTLDGALQDPRTSIIWTPPFMGNGNGAIRTGAFTGWTTPYGPLLRNFGDGGTTMNWTSIRDTFTRNFLAEISSPAADPAYNLEDHHGEPHLWVGGHMSPQALAGYDPIFIMHHSFIDLIWELFRRIQRRRGVDPTTDYPRRNTGPPGHGYNDPSGVGNLLNRHSLSDIFTTEIYTYQLPPTCSSERPTCGSPYLRCDVDRRRPRCVSASIFDVPPTEVFDLDTIIANLNIRSKRSIRDNPSYMSNERDVVDFTKQLNADEYSASSRVKRFVQNHHLHPERFVRLNSSVQNVYRKTLESVADVKCQPENINDHYVNNFNIDGVIDTSKWAFIPVDVTVVHERYGDVVSSRNMSTLYPKCAASDKLPFRVFIETNGLNYNGFFKETTHVRKDTPITSEITFVGVKKPSTLPTEFILTSYDSCGRICRPFCRTGSGQEFKPCTGTLRISDRSPIQYGDSAADVNRLMWSRDQYDIPYLNTRQLFVKVVCDTKSIWPW